jgi:hypothetical protein
MRFQGRLKIREGFPYLSICDVSIVGNDGEAALSRRNSELKSYTDEFKSPIRDGGNASKKTFDVVGDPIATRD